MSEPVRHAPGVICYIRKKSDNANLYAENLRAYYYKFWANLNGKTCVILNDLPSPREFFTQIEAKAWVVQLSATVDVPWARADNKFMGYTPHDVISVRQQDLVPIAGPGVGTDTSTDTEKPKEVEKAE